MKCRFPLLVVLCALTPLLNSCMRPEQPKQAQEIRALRGRTMQDVARLLGTPGVVDSSASATERIWGYYQVMIRSEANASPRQRTVLIVFRKRDSTFLVDDVRIP